MITRLSQIKEGWRNKLFPPEKIKDLIEEVSLERMKICEECPFISTKHKTIRFDVHCTDCGCTLSAKTKCLNCACPKGKWEAIKEEEND